MLGRWRQGGQLSSYYKNGGLPGVGAEGVEGMERGRGLLLQREQEGERKGGRVFLKTVAKGRYKESSALALCLGG